MSRPIGYYVHHHGAGHLARARAIADAAEGRIFLIGTGLGERAPCHPFVNLADDRLAEAFDGIDGDTSRPEALHYAPLNHEGVRRRAAAFCAWIAAARPALIVVDVSCEIAMLARLASVPVVYVRLAGARTDPPHLQAFAAATALIAPFAAALDDPAVPAWVREKTVYAPGLSARPPASQPINESVLVVAGRGGGGAIGADWARAARAVPDRNWTVIGPCTEPVDALTNLHLLGWVNDAVARIASAGVVVGGAGDGVVSAVLAARRPFICAPEDRPFAEQRSKADRLAAAGAAVVAGDLSTVDWLALLAAADRLSPDAAAGLDDPGGASRIAAWLVDLADGQHNA